MTLPLFDIQMKGIALLFLVFLLPMLMFAQAGKSALGIEGGPSLISLRGNPANDTINNPAIGFASGIFFQYNLSKVFSIKTNIIFERKGAVASGEILVTDDNGNIKGVSKYKVHTNFDYLPTSILLRATFGKKVSYYINAGLYFGYLTKLSFSVKYSDFLPDSTIADTNLTKRFDTGIVTGLGISVPVTKKISISCELRSNLGLYDLSKSSNMRELKTNSTNVLIGFSYMLRE
ncbi:MAG: PorT family protein [Saprospiraceae bacterium]|nr:PorT family protein [Saprospiraceae bacterium]